MVSMLLPAAQQQLAQPMGRRRCKVLADIVARPAQIAHQSRAAPYSQEGRVLGASRPQSRRSGWSAVVAVLTRPRAAACEWPSPHLAAWRRWLTGPSAGGPLKQWDRRFHLGHARLAGIEPLGASRRRLRHL